MTKEGKTNITTVGVVGAGTTGHGSVQVCAVAGLNATTQENGEAHGQPSLDTIASSLPRLNQKAKIRAAGKRSALPNNHTTTSPDALADVDILIHSATENDALPP